MSPSPPEGGRKDENHHRHGSGDSLTLCWRDDGVGLYTIACSLRRSTLLYSHTHYHVLHIEGSRTHEYVLLPESAMQCEVCMNAEGLDLNEVIIERNYSNLVTLACNNRAKCPD